MVEPLIILFAFLAGLLFRRFGFPPLPGYLLAGFICHALGLGDAQSLHIIADLGITLLLFTIGLKLDLAELAAPPVWAVAGLHMFIAIPLTALVIIAIGDLFPALSLAHASSAWALALALSFSSTVFAVKILEERGETVSLHARIAIGILVIQDLIAVAGLVLSSNQPPSLAAVALLALPLLRPALRLALDAAGHGELVALFGVAMALGTAALFESVHLKGGLGALAMGMILANTPKSKELYLSLINLKDLFLIGFFLEIGYYGLPATHMFYVTLVLGLIILIRPVIYYALFAAFRLRARTSLLASLALFNYSEFGLIVAAIAASHGLLSPQWVTTLALALSFSFFLATPVNTNAHAIYNRYSDWFRRFQRDSRLPEERPQRLGNAEVVILGMGRVGQGAYAYLKDRFAGNIVGVDENQEKVQQHRAAGVNCVHADVGDIGFWEDLDVRRRKLILVSLTNHSENLSVVDLARKFDYDNVLAVVARFPDEQAQLASLGCIAFNLYAEAGHGFAEHVIKQIEVAAADG